MKLEKIEHKHTLTNILKVALFSLFLMLPFINIASRCLYTICNKNAKDSYYGETINEKQYINVDINNLELTNEYSLISNMFISSETSPYFFMYIENLKDNITGLSYENANEIRIFYTSSYILRVISSTGNVDYNLSNNNVNLSFTNLGIYNKSGNINQFNFFYSVEYNKYSYLDNAFEYSFNNLENETWFNWTKNTPLYSGVNSMATGLGINNNVISMIITYWLILTTIYIVIDIVINCYTALTHIISGRKAT